MVEFVRGLTYASVGGAGSVVASSLNTGGTNIIDEWRTDEDIPLEKIVGLALPLDTIRQEMQDNKVWGEKLNQLLEIAKQYGWFVVNSEDVAFTDKLDNDLKNKKHQLN